MKGIPRSRLILSLMTMVLLVGGGGFGDESVATVEVVRETAAVVEDVDSISLRRRWSYFLYRATERQEEDFS